MMRDGWRSKPRRRVVMKLEVGADSWEDLEETLQAILFRLAERKRRSEAALNITSGGYSSGFTLEADEDPTVDHDSYAAWLGVRSSPDP